MTVVTFFSILLERQDLTSEVAFSNSGEILAELKASGSDNETND